MIKSKIRKNREQPHRIKLDQMRESMTEDQKNTNEVNQRPDSLNWLI